jgi:hypothetical protein
MDTTIVAALTRRNTYLEDTVSAQITGYPVAARVAAVRNFYRQADVVEARRFLDTEHIRYVILDTSQSLPFAPADASLRTVFSNSALTIYKYLPADMPANW